MKRLSQTFQYRRELVNERNGDNCVQHRLSFSAFAEKLVLQEHDTKKVQRATVPKYIKHHGIMRLPYENGKI